MIDKFNTPAAIERQDQTVEVRQIAYRHTGFNEGDLIARIEDGYVVVTVSTIDGESSMRVPAVHLDAIADLLAHISDDQ